MNDLLTSVNDRVILSFRKVLFSRNFADSAKFHENQTVTKISVFTVYLTVLPLLGATYAAPKGNLKTQFGLQKKSKFKNFSMP